MNVLTDSTTPFEATTSNLRNISWQFFLLYSEEECSPISGLAGPLLGYLFYARCKEFGQLVVTHVFLGGQFKGGAYDSLIDKQYKRYFSICKFSQLILFSTLPNQFIANIQFVVGIPVHCHISRLVELCTSAKVLIYCWNSTLQRYNAWLSISPVISTDKHATLDSTHFNYIVFIISLK